MDFTSRSIWDKQKRTNCYFYFSLLPFFQSKMRTEHHITSAFSKPLIIFLNFYCIGLFFSNFLLYCEILFFSFISSMQVLLQPFNHSHWLSPAPSLYIYSFCLDFTSWKVWLTEAALLICIRASLDGMVFLRNILCGPSTLSQKQITTLTSSVSHETYSNKNSHFDKGVCNISLATLQKEVNKFPGYIKKRNYFTEEW